MAEPVFPSGRTTPVLEWPATTGIAYFVAALTSLYLTRSEHGIATLWPPSGILFAALFAAPRRRAAAHLIAAGVASLAANVLSGAALLAATGFTVANLSEATLAVWLLRTRSSAALSFSRAAGLGCFCKVAVIGPAAGATIAAVLTGNVSAGFWVSWFTTDLLGILVVTPLVLIVGQAMQRKAVSLSSARTHDAIASLAMVAAVATLTFAQSSFPLLFLPMLAILVAVFRLGAVGAAGGVLIVATIASVAITLGSGPQTLMHVDPLTRSLFMQFYLLALFAAALPIAALLSARSRLLGQLSEQMRLLQLAEGAAQVGHWRVNVKTQRVTWSQEVFRIHGVAGRDPPALAQAIDAYHPDDRAMVAAAVERSIERCESFAFTARIVRPDGEIRTVVSRGEIDRVSDDGSFGLFGIIQDITVQVAHEAALDEARQRAEQAARDATILAETDPLTGIANRRRTMLVLEQAVVAARDSGQSVSVAMFDVDHFKRINDRYGHHGGDSVLRRVAADASRALRSGDTIGRFGGEEFVMVLPGTTAVTAMLVAERARSGIEAGGDDPCVTISVGVAELAVGESVEAMLRRADDALYAAKDGGRNTLRLAA